MQYFATKLHKLCNKLQTKETIENNSWQSTADGQQTKKPCKFLQGFSNEKTVKNRNHMAYLTSVRFTVKSSIEFLGIGPLATLPYPRYEGISKRILPPF